MRPERLPVLVDHEGGPVGVAGHDGVRVEANDGLGLGGDEHVHPPSVPLVAEREQGVVEVGDRPLEPGL